MLKQLTAATATLFALAAPAAAEWEFSLYLGVQSVEDSTASGTLPDGGGAFSKRIGWEGRSDQMPPYYGGRVMYWLDGGLGFGLEATHAKAYAPLADQAPQFTRLEFTDGHNIVTANVMKRWENLWKAATPYLGAGVGVAIPHVDIQSTVAGSPRTFGYETTGPALRLTAGTKYDLNDHWAVFGEYQMTWSDNEATIDGAAVNGRLDTELLTHAVNFGISYNF